MTTERRLGFGLITIFVLCIWGITMHSLQGISHGQDLTNGAQAGQFKDYKASVNCLAFSSDSKLVATGSDKIVRLWNLRTGVEVNKFVGHNGQVCAVCFSSDGKTLVSAATDHSVRLWDVATGDTIGKLDGHDKTVTNLVMSSDGKFLVTGGCDGKVLLWDFVKRRELASFSHEGCITCLALSDDTSVLAVGYTAPKSRSSVVLWHTDPKHEKATLLADTSHFAIGLYLLSGKSVNFALEDGTVYSYNLTRNKLISPYKHDGYLTSLAVVPNGDQVVLGSLAGAVIVVDRNSWKVVRQLVDADEVIRAVAVSPDAKIGGVISGADASKEATGILKFYNLKTGERYIPSAD